MKRKLIYQFFAFALLFAVGLMQVSAQYEQIQPPVEGDIFQVIGRLSKYIRPLVLVIFLGVSIYAGITIQTSAGDPEKTKKGWMTLQAGVIGFVVVALAPVIVEMIGRLIGVRGDLF